MLDAQITYWNCKEPVILMGRWTGNGTAVPNPVANTTRPTGPGNPQGGPMTIARIGTGNLTVQPPTPIGTIQNYDFWVASPANNKGVLVTPPAANGLFTLQVVWQSNNANVDLASTEELQMMVVTTIAPRP